MEYLLEWDVKDAFYDFPFVGNSVTLSLIHIFVDDVDDVKLGSSAGDGSFFQTVQFFLLTAVDAAADDFVIVILL